jgi:hypothetical protein
MAQREYFPVNQAPDNNRRNDDEPATPEYVLLHPKAYADYRERIQLEAGLRYQQQKDASRSNSGLIVGLIALSLSIAICCVLVARNRRVIKAGFNKACAFFGCKSRKKTDHPATSAEREKLYSGVRV